MLYFMIVTATALMSGVEGYYSQPALHDDTIIFVSEGDLWTATLSEDITLPTTAHRLTSDDGSESWPSINSQGTYVAFSAEYDGNVDIFYMPIGGGTPKRLTYHPGDDICLGFSPDGSEVLFRSSRHNPLGRAELWRVSIDGGMPTADDFGECSLAALNQGGKLIAFNRWSNEHWIWRDYRGGTAPDVWLGEFASGRFWQLTETDANELFPMWVNGRIAFISDRDGLMNLYSNSPRGNDLQQHTSFVFDPENPTHLDGYDIRWPSADSSPRGSKVIFTQAGQLVACDVTRNTVERLNITLASDRPAVRERFEVLTATMTNFSLSSDGSRILLESRGELFNVPSDGAAAIQLTRSSDARDFGGAWIDDEAIALISDSHDSGEQQIATVASDGSDDSLTFLTADREDWLFPPVVSPDGSTLAFADKTQRLHILDIASRDRNIIDRGERGEIVEYVFSPDAQWLAYSKVLSNGMSQIFLYSVRTGRSFSVSDELMSSSSPAWGPKGRFLFFLGESAINPVFDTFDFNFVSQNTTQVYALPLQANTPPPIYALSASTDFDLEAWANYDGAEFSIVDDFFAIQMDSEDISSRIAPLPIEPGQYTHLQALYGGLIFLSHPIEGIVDEVWPPLPPGIGRATAMHYDLVNMETIELFTDVSHYSISQDRSTIAWLTEDGIAIRWFEQSLETEPWLVEIEHLPFQVDIQQEFRQIFNEAWRLQRDFFWNAEMSGTDWKLIKVKYESLLPRISIRAELNDLIAAMISELGTSHTYISGGDEYDPKESVDVGLLGADIIFDGVDFRITNLLPQLPWQTEELSPLAWKHLEIKNGAKLLAIDQQMLQPGDNVYAFLQGKAGQQVTLLIESADNTTREIEVAAMTDESTLRYAAWVERNRNYVSEKSDGTIGYLHLPDMAADGLVAFVRNYYPQIRMSAMIIDVRNNGGGYVSQMIIEKLVREIWALSVPRHGLPETYPHGAFNGHLAVLIDQHAGSDGDIFPASFQIKNLGPLIGTRTWGGVIGIRMDKPFTDLGQFSQPEYAWWEAVNGFTGLENKGVTPDIEVDITPTDRQAGNDPQLDTAIQTLKQELVDSPVTPIERPK